MGKKRNPEDSESGKKGKGRRKKHPITTVTQCRVPLFWATKKPPRASQRLHLLIENSWGKALIEECRLTQVHRNLIDVIFAYHHGFYTYEDGAAGFLIDLYEIQNLLEIEATNHSWVKRKLEDLRKTTFVTETKYWVITGGIVRKHHYSRIYAGRSANKFNPNKFYYVVFEEEFMKFFDVDINMSYFKLLPKIIALDSAVCQALTRFCLSHRRVNADLEDIFSKIGVIRSDFTRQQKGKLFKEVFAGSEELIEEFGIQVNPMANKRLGVFYSQHKDVWFNKPYELPEYSNDSQ